jgi:hypothetical protein
VNILVTLSAIAVSLAALLWLSFTDPKRRRAFARPPYTGPRRVGFAWSAALLPGLFLPALAGGPGLVLWLGALTVIGWGLIAIPPGEGGALARAIDRLAAWLGHQIDAFGRGLAALRASRPLRARGAASAPLTLAARVAALEAQVRGLEADLARLRHHPPTSLSTEAPDARVA